MKNKKWMALVLTLVMIFSFGLAGCGGGKVKVDDDQHLNLSMTTPRTFDYQKATDSSSTQIITMIMDGLTRIVNDGNGDKIEAALAKEWTTSEDGKVWTFKLRDAKWSDGEAVTAQQFVDGWIRLLEPDNAFDYASFLFDIVGAKEFNAKQGKAEDVGIKAVDDKTFEVTLKAPVPYFIQLTPFKNLFPVRKDIIEKAGDKYGVDPLQMVFTGCFLIKEYAKGAKIAFEKNPNYWDADKVKLQKINMTYIEEEASRMQMFQAKQIDMTGARGEYADKFSKLAESKQLDKTYGYSPATYYVIFNCETGGAAKIFTNAKVRLAFGLALDREDYITNIYKRGYVAQGLIPPTLMIGEKEYRKEVPEPFKELIDQKTDVKALFQEGIKELGMDPNAQYTVKYLDNGTSSTDKIFQDWYKAQWENALGVKVEIDVCADEPQYWERVDNMEYDICTYGWIGDFNDPETFFNLFTTGNSNNPGRWTSPEYDDLYKKTKETADNNERLELFRQMEKILLVDKCAICPTSYGDVRAFRQPYVKGVMYTMFGSTEYKYTYTSGRQ